MFKLKLRRCDAPSYKSTVIEFPAEDYKLQEQLDSIGVGITTEKNCIVEEIRGENDGLASLVGQSINADEIQYLAKRMDSFDKDEMQTFYAAVHANKLNSAKDMINLTFNLHTYTVVCDFSDLRAIGCKHELNCRGCMTMDEIDRENFTEIGRRLIQSGRSNHRE